MKQVYCYEVEIEGEVLYTSTKIRDKQDDVMDISSDRYHEAHVAYAEVVKDALGKEVNVKLIMANEYLAMTDD